MIDNVILGVLWFLTIVFYSDAVWQRDAAKDELWMQGLELKGEQQRNAGLQEIIANHRTQRTD